MTVILSSLGGAKGWRFYDLCGTKKPWSRAVHKNYLLVERGKRNASNNVYKSLTWSQFRSFFV